MSFRLGEDGIKALKELKENLQDLSTNEMGFLILIYEILMILIKHKEEIEEYDEIMEQLKPLIKQELKFRSRDTQGTV